MIKKIIGFIATLAILAVVAFTVLGYGSYESMLPAKWFESIQTDLKEESAEVYDADTLIDLPVQDSVEIDSLQVDFTQELVAE